MAMKRRLRWLSRFLEVYARESLQEEIQRLNAAIESLTAALAEKEAYIAGLRESLRAIRKITANNEVK